MEEYMAIGQVSDINYIESTIYASFFACGLYRVYVKFSNPQLLGIGNIVTVKYNLVNGCHINVRATF